MNADVLQPLLAPKEPSFGGSSLFWPNPLPNRSLQRPLPFPMDISQGGGQIPSRMRPLVELAKEWVATISSTAPAARRRRITRDTELQPEGQSPIEDELDWNFYVEGLRPREVRMLRARFLRRGRYTPQFFDDLFE
jgi:hypothetical protein